MLALVPAGSPYLPTLGWQRQLAGPLLPWHWCVSSGLVLSLHSLQCPSTVLPGQPLPLPSLFPCLRQELLLGDVMTCSASSNC